MQESIPLAGDPFGPIARGCGYAPAELLALLNEWKRRGVLRRIGLIVRHREMGFAANGMCVWKVDPGRVEAAGRLLAGCPEVTHCYERRTPPAFPYNLFAMVHAGTREEAEERFARVASAAGLQGGRMLVSVREFKKSSPLFFAGSAETAARHG